jgi:replicative DNA helicase
VEAFKEVPPTESDSTDFITDDLNVLLDKAVVGGGFRWRLESLNYRLGPIRRGNMGCIFGRPEVGKTTFLSSQVTHMAGQTDAPILWFNNEEDGAVVKIRCYQAALGKDLPFLINNKERAFKEFMSLTKGNIKIFDEAKIRRSQVELLCNLYKPSLVVMDKLDFISGFDADRKDLELEAIYRWARELSKEFCPVIGVCHSDGAGEGVKYLNMGHMDNAKTAKQATCDWILGIGQVQEAGMDYVRGFHLSKNKLMGDSGTRPTLRHDKWDVIIFPDTCQFEDVKEK